MSEGQPEEVQRSTVHHNTSEAIKDTHEPWPPEDAPESDSPYSGGQKADGDDDVVPYRNPDDEAHPDAPGSAPKGAQTVAAQEPEAK
jgi:hypothetical protein